MQTIQLQSIGKVEATEAINLKVGDVTVWNFGFTEEIIEVLKVTAKTRVLKIKSESGKFFERRLKNDRLVGIKK